MTDQIPMVDYLVLDQPPHLQAYTCDGCQAVYFDRRNACAHCARDAFTRRPLSTEGTIRSFTIVHRAAPSVPAPYTSIVVDLDGGGVIKANLLDSTDPRDIGAQTRVRMQTFVAGTDDDGTEAVGFGFRRTEVGA